VRPHATGDYIGGCFEVIDDAVAALKARIMELPDHPFFVATLFVRPLSSSAHAPTGATWYAPHKPVALLGFSIAQCGSAEILRACSPSTHRNNSDATENTKVSANNKPTPLMA
jgi:hypothetical protein